MFGGVCLGVQRLDNNDIDIAIQVSKIFYGTLPDRDKILRFLDDHKNYLLINKVNNNIAGFAYGYGLTRFDGKNSMMYLHAIEVLPEYRRQGIGKGMINELVEICKKNNFLKMFLITETSNIPAVALYEKTGGVEKYNNGILFDYEF
jgi:aminoglycoside 6'-N-acetyltransferase I